MTGHDSSFLEPYPLSIIRLRALGPKMIPSGRYSSPKQCYFVSQKISIPNHTMKKILCKGKDKWHFLWYANKCKAIKHVHTHNSCVSAIMIKRPYRLLTLNFSHISQMTRSSFQKIPECPLSHLTFILPGINS